MRFFGSVPPGGTGFAVSPCTKPALPWTMCETESAFFTMTVIALSACVWSGAGAVPKIGPNQPSTYCVPTAARNASALTGMVIVIFGLTLKFAFAVASTAAPPPVAAAEALMTSAEGVAASDGAAVAGTLMVSFEVMAVAFSVTVAGTNVAVAPVGQTRDTQGRGAGKGGLRLDADVQIDRPTEVGRRRRVVDGDGERAGGDARRGGRGRRGGRVRIHRIGGLVGSVRIVHLIRARRRDGSRTVTALDRRRARVSAADSKDGDRGESDGDEQGVPHGRDRVQS